MTRIKVTCAVIEYDDKVLVVQRSAKMKLPLKWEFPGGKVEEGESDEACIIREIMEELNIDITISQKLQFSEFDYPNVSIVLIPFIAKQIGGVIKLKEHLNYKYLTKFELINLDWAEADIPILNEYLKNK